MVAYRLPAGIYTSGRKTRPPSPPPIWRNKYEKGIKDKGENVKEKVKEVRDREDRKDRYNLPKRGENED
jgi:hypothetical protein